MVRLTLTQHEADMLDSVARNGWGDGDFASWLDNKKDANACERAMEKLLRAKTKAKL